MMDSPDGLQDEAMRLMEGFERHGRWDAALSELDDEGAQSEVTTPLGQGMEMAPPPEQATVPPLGQSTPSTTVGQADAGAQADQAEVQREPVLPGIKPLGDPFGDNDTPVLPVTSQLHGQVPMSPMPGIERQYPNLRSHSHVDWQHLNPRLLHTLQKLGEKRGLAVVISSGYRDILHNEKIGGAKHSNHMRGTAIDAFVNGHPIGEVFTPEELAKVGIRSGALNYPKGKPDSSHVDLMGTPIKTRTKEAKK